jgi:hypothetical protein
MLTHAPTRVVPPAFAGVGDWSPSRRFAGEVCQLAKPDVRSGIDLTDADVGARKVSGGSLELASRGLSIQEAASHLEGRVLRSGSR